MKKKSFSSPFFSKVAITAENLIYLDWAKNRQRALLCFSRLYQTCLHLKTAKSIKIKNFKFTSFQKKIYSFFSFSPQSRREAAILPVSKNKRVHYPQFRFVSQQECLFPHCHGTFSISSF